MTMFPWHAVKGDRAVLNDGRSFTLKERKFFSHYDDMETYVLERLNDHKEEIVEEELHSDEKLEIEEEEGEEYDELNYTDNDDNNTSRDKNNEPDEFF